MRAQLELRAARLAAGDEALGWKLGFGTPAALERLALGGPLVGFLVRSALVPSGGSVPVGSWTKPAAEPEIAVHLGREVPPGAGETVVREAIAALGPAIELADVDRELDDVEAILTANIFQRHVALGPPDIRRAGGSVEGLTARVWQDGVEVGSTDTPEELTGELVGLVRHLADVLGAFGEKLSAGDVVIAGSVVPPLAVGPGSTIRVYLAGCEEIELFLVETA